MANKYGYQVHKQNVSQSTSTRHITINIIKLGEVYDSDTGSGDRGDRIIELTWQSGQFPNEDGEPRYWYGCRFTPSDIDSIADLVEVTRLARRLLPADRSWFGFQPSKLVETCEKKRIKRVWYDSRLSRYVKRADIPDLTLDRWLALDERGYCTVDCLAINEDEAGRLLLLAFAQAAANGYYHSNSEKNLESWLARGKPMRNSSTGSWGQSAPEVVKTAVLLRLDEVLDEEKRTMIVEAVA